jgi:hypothetical protein
MTAQTPEQIEEVSPMQNRDADRQVQAEQELRKAFDAGRNSGLQLKGENLDPLSCTEIALILERSGLPCISGPWQEIEPGVMRLKRVPCQRENTHICDVWRESVDGLVMGAGENARYSRHSSFADPGPACIDMLYPEDQPQWRLAAVPEAYQPLLENLNAELAKYQAEIHVLGYAERQLFYQLKDHHPALAGRRQGFLELSLQKWLSESEPRLKLVEMSPRAVWNGD